MNYRLGLFCTRDEWSQAPCLMTSVPAVRAMTPPAGVIRLDAPSGVPHAVVPTVALEAAPIVVLTVVLIVVLTVVLIVVLTVVLTVVLEAAPIVRDSAAVRCWRR